MPWFMWAGIAIFLGLAELHAPGVYLVWIALGATAMTLLTILHQFSLEAQLGLFLAFSAVSSILGWFVYRTANRTSLDFDLNERAYAMVGLCGTVAVPIQYGSGKVRVGDTVWLADGPELPESAPVRVRAVRGSRLIVEALGEKTAPDAPKSS
ncbi:NfeD family protein [Rhodoblastus sp.]|uniref:NfeD family protein n=1 Tax=Rhodoblastus sp. TaxID=1962975 RepID=UPI0025EDCD38|nr:NfeD family protein [Rhodoblastus sp.]